MDGPSLPRIFLSVVTIAEIEDGIAKSIRTGATAKASGLSLWLETIMHLYADRILTFDLASARITGTLSDRARGAGLAPGFTDFIIAATAKHHGSKILTRNLRHFAPMGVEAIDPFVSLPSREAALF